MHPDQLGAGTGAVALALLACRRASTATITDIPDMLPHLRRNVELNTSVLPGPVDRQGLCRFASVQALRWGAPGADIPLLGPLGCPPFDLIVGSDLMYACKRVLALLL